MSLLPIRGNSARGLPVPSASSTRPIIAPLSKLKQLAPMSGSMPARASLSRDCNISLERGVYKDSKRLRYRVVSNSRPVGQTASDDIGVEPAMRTIVSRGFTMRQPFIKVSDALHGKHSMRQPLLSPGRPSLRANRCPIAQPRTQAIGRVSRSAEQIGRHTEPLPEHTPAQKGFGGRAKPCDQIAFDIPAHLHRGSANSAPMCRQYPSEDVPAYCLIDGVYRLQLTVPPVAAQRPEAIVRRWTFSPDVSRGGVYGSGRRGCRLA